MRRPLLLLALLALASPALAQEPQPAEPLHAIQGENPASTGGEHGEQGAHHGIDPKTLGLQILNFGALLFILIKFGGGAVNKALRARHDQLKSDMDEAARLRSAAEARFLEHQRRLDNLEQEIATMRQAIHKEAESEKARIVAAAEDKAKRILADTRFQLEQQIKDADIRFRAEVAAAAMKIATEILRRSVTPSDEQRLAQSFVAELVSRAPETKGPARARPSEETVS